MSQKCKNRSRAVTAGLAEAGGQVTGYESSSGGRDPGGKRLVGRARGLVTDERAARRGSAQAWRGKHYFAVGQKRK